MKKSLRKIVLKKQTISLLNNPGNQQMIGGATPRVKTTHGTDTTVVQTNCESGTMVSLRASCVTGC